MYRIVAERRTAKRTQAILGQLDQCVALSLRGGRGRGWQVKVGLANPEREGDLWLYRQTITYTLTRPGAARKWQAILTRFVKAAVSRKWSVVEPPGFEDTQRTVEEPKTLGTVHLTPHDYFDRIYGREAQINRVLDAIKLAQRTDWLKRVHCLLDGDPGSGKSEIMMAVAQMLGKEGEAWRRFDATAMTRAGAIEEIIKSPVVPPVLFIEEIEKCEEHALRWLLGVMDTRGEVRRTNYRVGTQARNVRMLVVATANDVPLLRGVLAGALYSRFQNRIYCPPPDREIMRRILEREQVEIKGRQEWVEPTLAFAYDKLGQRDPRSIIAVYSLGGDRLLDGSYQRDYLATLHPEDHHGT